MQVKDLVTNMFGDWEVREKLQDCQLQSPVMVASAFNLSEWIEYLFNTAKSEETGTHCMAIAARYGSCEVLIHLIQANVPLNPETALNAARNNRNGKEVMTLLLDWRGDQITVKSLDQ